VKRAVFATVALLATAAAGALVLPRPERDDRTLAGLFDDDVTIVSAQRVDGHRGGLSQLVVNWGRTDPARHGVIVEEGLSVYDGLVLLGRHSLVTYEGVVRRPGDHGIHCCWSRYSLTVRKLRAGSAGGRTAFPHQPPSDRRRPAVQRVT